MSAEGQVLKAKIRILEDSVFFSTVLFGLTTTVTKQHKTAATDGKSIFFNPDFIFPLSLAQLMGLTLHELYHVMLKHLTRIGDRDREKYAYACDYAINIQLTDEGYELPPGGLLDEKFRGMSVEQIYDKIETIEIPTPTWGGDDLIEPDSEIEADELDQALTELVSQAVMAADLKDVGGEVPSSIRNALDKMLNPKLDWKTLLQDYVADIAKDDYSWSRPNKKYLPDFYLPSQYSETIKHMVCGFDLSISVSDEEVREYLSEVDNLRQCYAIERLTLYSVDTAIRSRVEVSEFDNLLDLKLKGGGGTMWNSFFSELNKNPPTLLIMFSDMQVNFDFPKPNFDVIYINTYDGAVAPTGYGRTINMNQ